MRTYFPSKTVEWKLEEPRAFRRFSISLVEMAIVAGVLLRLYRALVLTHGRNSWVYLGGTFALGLLFLLFMATAHLANFPRGKWWWRAPLFAFVEAASETATSAFLVWVGREPNGTVRADWDDWSGMAANTLLTRGAAVMLWALLLAGAIAAVRRTRIVHEEKEPA